MALSEGVNLRRRKSDIVRCPPVFVDVIGDVFHHRDEVGNEIIGPGIIGRSAEQTGLGNSRVGD